MSEHPTQKTLSQEVTDAIYDANGIPHGWDDGGEDSESYVRTYSREEAGQMLSYLQDWLPATLAQTPDSLNSNTEPNITTEQDAYMREGEENFVWHRLTQTWGHKPNPEDLKAGGPIIEVGGPTTERNGPLEVMYGVSPDVVSNVVTSHGNTQLELDMLADGTSLPFPDESVGTEFASCIPGVPRERSQLFSTLRDDVLTEAARVVKPGGRVIWNGGTPRDVDTLLNLGFMPEYIEARSVITENLTNGDYTHPSLSFNGSFVKTPAAAT